MKVAKRYVHLTKEKLLTRVSPEDIYKRYLGTFFILGKPIKSPLRADNNPSFSIHPKTMLWKDFATGESGDVFDFVARYTNESKFKNVLFHIQTHMNISDSEILYSENNYTPLITDKYNGNKVNNADIKVKFREFEPYDKVYWQSYGIRPKLLAKSRVAPISHYFINGKPFVAEKHAYVFIEKKDNIVTYKIYQPFSRTRKWISNNNSSIWELWHMLPETGKLCIITSSRKDAMSMIALNTFLKNVRYYSSSFQDYIEHVGIVALQSEMVVPKPQIVEELKNRFEKVIIYYDNDLAGKRFAKKIGDLYGLEYYYVPSGLNCKDISDVIRYEGVKIAENAYKDLIVEASPTILIEDMPF